MVFFSKVEARGAGFFTHHVNLVLKLGRLAMTIVLLRPQMDEFLDDWLKDVILSIYRSLVPFKRFGVKFLFNVTITTSPRKVFYQMHHLGQ